MEASDSDADSDADSDSDSDSTSGDTDEDDTGSSGDACGGECLDIGPAWNGPVVLSSGETAPACDDDSAPEFTAFTDLVAPPAACECSCGEPNVACPESGEIINRGDPGPVCLAFVPPVWTENVTAGCNDIPDVTFGANVLRLSVDQPANIDSASCISSSSTDVTPPSWENGWSGCSAEAALGECEVCSDNVAGLCIWQEGDVACDVPGFAEKTLMFTDVDDGRTCSDCTCGDVTGRCTGSVTYRAGDTCNLGTVGEGDAGDCVEADFARGADLEFSDDLGCEAADVSPVGAATPIRPITACCAG